MSNNATVSPGRPRRPKFENAKIEEVSEPRSPDAVWDKMLPVIEALAKKRPQGKQMTVSSACKRCRVDFVEFNVALRQYDDLYALAYKAGVRIRGRKLAPGSRPPTVKGEQKSVVPDIWVSGIRGTPELQPFTIEKEEAVSAIVEMLRIGSTFDMALKYAGVSKEMVARWVSESPDLRSIFWRAEATFNRGLMLKVNEAVESAADKGRLEPLLDLLARKSPMGYSGVQDTSAELADILRSQASSDCLNEDGPKKEWAKSGGPLIVIELEKEGVSDEEVSANEEPA